MSSNSCWITSSLSSSSSPSADRSSRYRFVSLLPTTQFDVVSSSCPADGEVQGTESQRLAWGSSRVSGSVVARRCQCASVREELRARGRRWCSWGYGLHGRWTMTGGTCRSPPHNIAPDTSPHLHHDLPALTHTHPRLTPLFATPLTPARRPYTNSRTHGRTHTHTHIHARVHTCTGLKQKRIPARM